MDKIFLARRFWRFPAHGKPAIYGVGDTMAAVQYAEHLDRGYCSMPYLPDDVSEASVIDLVSALASIQSTH